MNEYAEKKFDIPALRGLSERQVKEHLKLYSGYVKHVNILVKKLKELENGEGDDAYIANELRRRFSFEFDGMRLHEIYFHCLEGGAAAPEENSSLYRALEKQYGSFEKFLSECAKVCGTRGIGWTILYFDKAVGKFAVHFADEHQIGHPAGLSIVLAVDVWEHAYMIDYAPSEKKKYVESYFSDINWKTIEKEFGN